MLDAYQETQIKRGPLSEAPCPVDTTCAGKGGKQQPVLDSEGVSLETPWTSNLTLNKRRGSQHIGGNRIIHKRVHRDIDNDGLTESLVRAHSKGSYGQMRSKYAGNCGRVGKHGRIASPIAEKPPWH